MSVYLRADSKA